MKNIIISVLLVLLGASCAKSVHLENVAGPKSVSDRMEIVSNTEGEIVAILYDGQKVSYTIVDSYYSAAGLHCVRIDVGDRVRTACLENGRWHTVREIINYVGRD